MKTKTITLKIPNNIDGGFNFLWEDNSVIKTKVEHDTFLLSANKEGLLSLGRHLISLAQDNIKNKEYLDFDEFNDLEKNSKRIVFIKNNDLN